MTYFVYMLKCVSCKNKRTYVGYTNNLKTRIIKHNSGKGAKYTRGNNWVLIYKKKFLKKSKAMSYEYLLKKDKIKRLEIYKKS
jgi:putative endonuclease